MRVGLSPQQQGVGGRCSGPHTLLAEAAEVAVPVGEVHALGEHLEVAADVRVAGALLHERLGRRRAWTWKDREMQFLVADEGADARSTSQDAVTVKSKIHNTIKRLR